jgi:plasmid stabilization system protein ParE
MLADEGFPALELKWGRIRGRFSAETQLRRLSAGKGRRLSCPPRPRPLAPEWAKALGPYAATAFTWRAPAVSATGVILHCPECRNATLIQLYHRESERVDALFGRVLAGFQDHPRDGQVRWCLYDIRAVVPQTFTLVRYRLEAGAYALVFRAGRQTVTLYRWGPAAVLLAGRDLAQFARQAGLGPYSGTAVRSIDARRVEWAVAPDSVGWIRRRFHLTGAGAYQWGRLWHLEDRNRILGLVASGASPLDVMLLDRICQGYESL